MINQKFKEMTQKKSQIREMFMYGLERKRIVGEDNVFDYSLGNPSVSCPQDFNDAIIDIINTKNPIDVHGYSPSLGNEEAIITVADSLYFLQRSTPIWICDPSTS